jgi:hypothetical protein
MFTSSTAFRDAPFSTSTRTVSVCPFTIANDREVIPLFREVLAGQCVCVWFIIRIMEVFEYIGIEYVGI